MGNKTNESHRFHDIIKTKHVFIEDNQVFIKRDSVEYAVSDNHGELWYPINFQWIPVKALEQHLIHQHAPLKDGA